MLGGIFAFRWLSYSVAGRGVVKNRVRSHFWVTFGSLWGRSARVTFESLLGHFNSFCASVELGGRPLHNFRGAWRPYTFSRLKSRHSGGATEPLRPRWRPPPDLTHPDPILTPFWPDFDLNLTQLWPWIAPKGQSWVKFRSKIGSKRGQNRVGVSQVWGWASSRSKWLCSSSESRETKARLPRHDSPLHGLCPVTHSLGHHGRMLHPFKSIHANTFTLSREYGPLRLTPHTKILSKSLIKKKERGCSCFCLQLKELFYLQLTILFFTCNWSFFTYNFRFFVYNWRLFACNWKVHAISALRVCKQRSLTVSKKSSNCKSKTSPKKEHPKMTLPNPRIRY